MQKKIQDMNITIINRPVIICRSVILLLLFSTQITYSQRTNIPFYDDFSQTKNSNPNPNLWINGGVSINNTFAINQPSINVATFDGRNALGIPYNFSNKFAYGITDTLASRPIDLSSFTASDSLYLSFYWEARGLGDLPDSDDTLMVSFLNNQNKWIPIWKQSGGVSADNFKQVLLVVKKTEFFHQNFQFKFEAMGRQSGPFDTWHIDFVYFNKNRRLKDVYTQDIALRGFKNSYLKRYSAMPLKQYLVNPAAEINSTIEVNINNLQKSARLVNFTWQITDTLSKTTYVNIKGGNETIITPNPPTKKNPTEAISNFSQKQAVLKFSQKLSYEGSGVIIIPDSTNNIPDKELLANDSISIFTPLLDYYAYDDGTAEIGADTDQNFGKVAVKFVLNKPDTVNAVRFNFSPYFKDISGLFFLLQIHASENGKPGKILHQQNIKVQYPTKINGFTEYVLDMNVPVKDTFFVAWTKVYEDVIAVGIDKNSPQFADNIYYNKGFDWIQNTSLKGSLMVRPVMGFKIGAGGQNGTPLASEEPIDRQFVVYPNPTSDVLKWNFDNIKSISIFDASGREVFYKNIDNQEVDLKNLPESTYYIKFSDGKKNFIRKIVVLH